MKQLFITMAVSFFLFSHARHEILLKNQTELLASKDAIVPDSLSRPCFYSNTGTKYLNGYCGTGNTTISVI